MDIAVMQFAAEAQAAAPPKGAGKTAASQGKDDGGFEAMFAGLVAAGQPQGDEEAKPDAETQAASEASPGLTPGMWNAAVLLAQLPLTPAAGQPTVAQTAQDTAGAVAPLMAATGQTATAAQPPPMPQLTVPATDDAGQQALPEATGQGAAQTLQQPQPASASGQTPPATPAMQAVPVTTPAATPSTPATATTPAPTTEAGAAPIPAATDIPAPAEQPTAAAPDSEAAAGQQAKPTVVTQAAITAAIAGGQRQPEKSAAAPVTAAATDSPTLTATAATMRVAAGGEAQAAGDDSSALTAESFPSAAQNAAPTAETAASSQAFAGLVDQAAGRTNAADDIFAPAGSQTTASAQDPHDVAGQIVDHARLITRAANSEMVIKLKPEHLGELTLKIVVDSGAVSATFHTANAEVRAAIEASLPQLRQDMANQGLKVDNVGVYASLDHFFANDQRHAPQQQQAPQTARRTDGDEGYADTVATVAAIGSQTTGGSAGIDYRV